MILIVREGWFKSTVTDPSVEMKNNVPLKSGLMKFSKMYDCQSAVVSIALRTIFELLYAVEYRYFEI